MGTYGDTMDKWVELGVMVDPEFEYLLSYRLHLTGHGRLQFQRHDPHYPNKLLHRVIAELAGLDISKEIDHRNRNYLDNRVENLRPADRYGQCQNASLRVDNKTGVKGVVLRPNGKYTARVQAYGKRKYIGAFDTLEDARVAIESYRANAHGEFACHG